ncbi:MAG: hypothetical protein IIW97_02585 [Alistipes sp.]|nr:hypothetical protein [Alistipes sp.]
MGLKRIDERLSRVTTIIKGWNGNKNVPRIERDLALEELRHIYDEILDYTTEGAEDTDEERFFVRSTESNSDVVDDFDDALDIDALLGIGEENESEEGAENAENEVAEEIVEEVAEEVEEETVEEVAEPMVVEPEPQPEEEVAQSASGALFNLDDIPVRAKSGRKMVHLYDDGYTPRVAAPKSEPREESPIVAEVVAPKPEPQPVVATTAEEQPQRLGDVLGGGVTTLADVMAASDEPTTPFNRVEELRKAIGLNDKFLMIRDLFDGDAERYEATIDTLDEFEDLDECMIYIVENFRWNPDSEAAKLIVSLLERKLA